MKVFVDDSSWTFARKYIFRICKFNFVDVRRWKTRLHLTLHLLKCSEWKCIWQRTPSLQWMLAAHTFAISLAFDPRKVQPKFDFPQQAWNEMRCTLLCRQPFELANFTLHESLKSSSPFRALWKQELMFLHSKMKLKLFWTGRSVKKVKNFLQLIVWLRELKLE